ncbi:hypothetical protein RF11_10030 [Thelohanellus kitauei]|uniref:Winged helix-turn helix domain-containing protein n=1 Tax=Thelohanellus kitauei TaxID=669202 RepID=A0A0C2NJT1_THEKT|nr:hypothetical protein RF11_10030 [Thelohanellus kitauei]
MEGNSNNHIRRSTISTKLRTLIIRMVIDEGRSQKVTYFQEGRRGGAYNTILNEDIKSRIVSLISDDQTHTIQEIKPALNVEADLTTVWRWVKSLGYMYKVTRPIYERRNDPDIKQQRVEYIRWYTSNSSIFRYLNIIFVDENTYGHFEAKLQTQLYGKGGQM